MKFAGCFALVAFGAEGLRRGARKHGDTKFILGDIPILNYGQAYKQKGAALAEASSMPGT